MIGLIIIVILGILIMPVLIKCFLFFMCVILPIVLSLYLFAYLFKRRRFNKAFKLLNDLTQPEQLKILKKEDKKRLASLVDRYYNDRKSFNTSFKDDLTWFGVGYSVNEMGIDRAVRIGVGYRIIRNLLRKPVDKLMHRVLEHGEE